MLRLDNLDSKKDLEDVLYHFRGLLEAAEEIRSKIQLVDQSIDEDLERATDSMGRLQAEIYTHLAYHMKELRQPFARWFRLSCKVLEKTEKEAESARRAPAHIKGSTARSNKGRRRASKGK